MSVIVCKRFEISYAHYLQDYDGKCANLHGHNAIVELKYKDFLPKVGMVKDFSEIKNGAEKVIKNELDHKNLNDLKFFQNNRTTAENICFYIEIILKEYKLNEKLYSVTVWEDRDSYAELFLLD